ncbi:MAG: SCP2 sterol-binding domain-containing protein [Candidatus Hodarchaeales archaeon]|jgi:putative sterol carrier protein
MNENEALEAINKMLGNFNTEKAKKQFRKWTKTMAFEFTDLGPKSFYTNIEKGTPGEIIEGEPEKANIKITTDTATWAGIMRGEISGMKAYTAKKIKVKGSMPDLLKLQKLMK